MSEEAIFKGLVEAKTAKAIEALINSDIEDSKFSWRLVGDRENNYGTTGMASDALASIVERY